MVLARRLLLVVVTAAVLFGGWRLSSENSTPVAISYGAGVLPELPLWAVVVCAFAAGAGLVAVYTVYRAIRAGLVARRYRVALQGLEAEVHQLRNLPLAAEEPTDEDAVPELDGGETRGG